MGRPKWHEKHLTPEQRERIVKIRAENPRLSYRTIGERFGVSADLVGKIVRDAGAALPPTPAKH
jgi:hypothetical protein